MSDLALFARSLGVNESGSAVLHFGQALAFGGLAYVLWGQPLGYCFAVASAASLVFSIWLERKAREMIRLADKLDAKTKA